MNGTYLQHRPRGALASIVTSFWYCEGLHYRQRIERRLPSNALQIVIDLANDRVPVWDPDRLVVVGYQRPALVVGLPTRSSVIDTSSLESMLGVVFRSGRGRAFFDVPIGDLAGQELDLDLLWGATTVDRMRDRLRSAPTSAAKFLELERILTERLQPSESHSAVSLALEALGGGGGEQRVTHVATEAGVSGRRLTQLFHQQVGLTPKLYARVQRLQKFLRQLQDCDSAPDLAALALECGYYDQAHLAHDFREFAAFTPREFVARERPWPNHVALD